MTSALLPVAICLMSAISLAATNVLVKRGGDILTSRMVLSIVMALSVLPLAFFVPLPPRDTWHLIALSTAVHWFYQFSAIRALHRGDLSLVFPVMRGLGPLATATFAGVMLHEALSVWQVAGLFAASAAIIVFAMPTGATVHARRLDRAALFWSVMTALGVGLYAVADAQAVREMPNFLTFVVLRETSVVFAAAFSAILLHEGFGRRRTIAAAVLACGLVLMQAGA